MSTASTSVARLTSLSTQTLSLLLERQRLQSLNQPAPAASTAQITRNLVQLRAGILALEAHVQSSGNNGNGNGKAERETSALLRNQFTRMREMLGGDASNVESLPPIVKEAPKLARTPDPASLASSAAPSNASTPPPVPQKDTRYVPYSDEPPPSPDREVAPAEVLEQQRLLMEEQDGHLEHLSRSVGRQRDISLQINDELTVHNGLLSELEEEVDETHSRLGNARKRLQRFSRGVKGNLSTYIIAGIIFVLLILIIIFKT